ncbi:MAG: hypothetical protein AB1435_03150 [Chloroflexota bacterium]|jgi:uncharacterized membrane protein YcaP (DUF421 family)
MKQLPYALLIVGIVLVLGAILIDPIRGHDIYLATSQIIVLVVGAVVALVGAYLAFVRKSAP